MSLPYPSWAPLAAEDLKIGCCPFFSQGLCVLQVVECCGLLCAALCIGCWQKANGARSGSGT